MLGAVCCRIPPDLRLLKLSVSFFWFCIYLFECYSANFDLVLHFLASLCDRLLDYDENVRKLVVAVICDVARHSLASIPVETVKLVAERLRDKSVCSFFLYFFDCFCYPLCIRWSLSMVFNFFFGLEITAAC